MIHSLPEWLVLGFEVLMALGTVCTTVATFMWWLSRGMLVTKSELATHVEEHGKHHAQLDARLAEGEQRFAVIETELKYLPKAQDINELASRIGGVEQTMSGFGAQLDGLREVLERVERPLNTLIDHQLKRDDR